MLIFDEEGFCWSKPSLSEGFQYATSLLMEGMEGTPHHIPFHSPNGTK